MKKEKNEESGFEFFAIDKSTGEQKTLNLSQPKRTTFGEDYMALFLNDDLLRLAKIQNGKAGKKDPSKDLGINGFRILVVVLANLGYENDLSHLGPADIEEMTGMTRSQISLGISQLKAAGVLHESKSKRLSLDPGFGWRGRAATFRKRIQADQKASSSKTLKIVERDMEAAQGNEKAA